MLKLDNVTISYKNVPTVQNFNLDMKEGQIVSLVGESGSGKTTVIRAVLGLLAGGGKVTEGSITFEGEDLLSYTHFAFSHALSCYIISIPKHSV